MNGHCYLHGSYEGRICAECHGFQIAPATPVGAEHLLREWRTGRKIGRTIYAQLGDEPSDEDPLIGVMDTRELAEESVVCHNEHRVLKDARRGW